MARFPSVVLDLTRCHVISPLDTLAKLFGNFSATGQHSRQSHANDKSISSTNHPKGCKRIIACGLFRVRKYHLELFFFAVDNLPQEMQETATLQAYKN